MRSENFYRFGFYGCVGALILIAVVQMAAMDHAPFKASDMRSAYLQGCAQGSRSEPGDNTEKCEISADMFHDTLDSLDKQMNQ